MYHVFCLAFFAHGSDGCLLAWNVWCSGWGLGEGNLWHKFTNYEHSVRVPLLVKVPWISGLAGKIIGAPVELIDIYPTAASLTRSGASKFKFKSNYTPSLMHMLRQLCSWHCTTID